MSPARPLSTHRTARGWGEALLWPAASLGVIGAAVVIILGSPAPAFATDAPRVPDRVACARDQPGQDLAACLREAAAARAEARRGALGNGVSPEQRQRNALARCANQPVDQHAACEKLALGDGQRSGSVAEGAVIKQMVTRDVGEADPAGQAPAAANRPVPSTPASPASAASSAVAGPPASSPPGR